MKRLLSLCGMLVAGTIWLAACVPPVSAPTPTPVPLPNENVTTHPNAPGGLTEYRFDDGVRCYVYVWYSDPRLFCLVVPE